MEGFTEIPLNNLGGAYTRVPPGKVPIGFAIDARNCRFSGRTVNVRPGRTAAFQSISKKDRITGFEQFKTQDAEIINAYFTSAGFLEREVVNGNGVTSRINPAAIVPNHYATFTSAYNRLFMGFSPDLFAQSSSANGTPLMHYKDVAGKMQLDEVGLPPNTVAPASASSTPTTNPAATPPLAAVSINPPAPTINIAGGSGRTGTLVTIFTTTPHGFAVGDVVQLSGNTPADFNAVVTIEDVPTPSAFDYHQAGPDENITGFGTIVDGTQSGIFRQGNQVTVTTAIAHGLLVNETTSISGVTDVTFNGGPFTVSSVPAPNQFTYDQPGNDGVSGNGTETPSVTQPPSSGLPSGIQIGQRSCVVAGLTRTGYIGGATASAILTFTLTQGNLTLTLTGIPVFPQKNVVARVVFFTPALGSTGGPWFYIPKDVVIDGVTQKSTIIPDNSSTVWEFNFSDQYLSALNDQTNFIFDVQQITNEPFVYYSPNQKRLMWWGDDDHTVRVSEIDLPEVYRISQGFVQAGFGNKFKIMGIADFKTTTLIMKDQEAYFVADNSNAPNRWAVPRAWSGSGPCGPRAYDVCNDFLAYASIAGLHIYLGDVPIYIAQSNHGTKDAYWTRINWKAASLIWVKIDEDRKEIHIGVPIDGDTVPSKVILVSYSNGWDKTMWSFDDNWAHSAHKVKRTTPQVEDPADAQFSTTILWQILFASSYADGTVQLQDPSRKDDNGQGIDQFYQIPYVSLKQAKINGVYKLGGVDVVANGVGPLSSLIYPIRSGDKPSEPFPLTLEQRKINLHGETEVFHRNFEGRNASWFSISFSNNKQPGNWFELHSTSLWMALAWENRP